MKGDPPVKRTKKIELNFDLIGEKKNPYDIRKYQKDVSESGYAFFDMIEL